MQELVIVGAIASIPIGLVSVVLYRAMRDKRRLDIAHRHLVFCAHSFAGLCQGAIAYNLIDPSLRDQTKEILDDFNRARAERDRVLGIKPWLI